MEAQPSGIRLRDEDAALVKGMLARGDRQHDIAAWFGVNGGRIGEISTGAKFSDVKPADPADLPARAVLVWTAIRRALGEARAPLRGRIG